MVTAHAIAMEPEHRDVIKALAAQIHRPVEEVNDVYVEALETLNSDARIKDFLIVLVRRKVRDELRLR